MLSRFKQLFCEHFFITYAQHKPYYISSGDEYHDRRSTHYLHVCQKCNKKIESVSKWTNDKVKSEMLKRGIGTQAKPEAEPIPKREEERPC